MRVPSWVCYGLVCCVYASRAGLWVFSRSPKRDEALIKKVRDMAVSRGIDVAPLRDVQHIGCKYA